MIVFGQSGCNRAKVVVFGQSAFIGEKVVVFGQSGCNRAKVVVFGQGGRIHAKLVVFGQSGCIRAKWLYSCKIGFIRAKVVVTLEQSGCTWTKVVVLGQTWLYSGESCSTLTKVVLFGHK